MSTTGLALGFVAPLYNSNPIWLSSSARQHTGRYSNRRLHPRTGIIPLVSWYWSKSKRRPCTIFGVDAKKVLGPVWWEGGSPLQSLQIACRDDTGKELDPWSLSELLMECGAMSVSVDDAARGTPEEVPLFHDHEPPQAFEQSFEAPFASGRKDLWGANSRVLALFPVDWDLSGVITAIEEVFELASPLAFRVDDVIQKDWVKSVQETWEPIETGKLRIRFPWHDPLPPSELQPGQVELLLEGGKAFGTGEHATTAMCCAWLEKVAGGSRVLDYGSGSGILGFAALKFGAREAVGIELDLEAIAMANANAANNDLHVDTYYPQEIDIGGRLDLNLTKLAVPEEPGLDACTSGAMGLFPVADGEAIPASELGTFDVTVSNILAGTLVRLEPVLACLTKAGGKLALTGVLEEQADTVLEAYRDTFDVSVTETLEGWVLITGVRRDL